MSLYSGTYTINNDKLICNVNTKVRSDISPDLQVSFNLVFKIINSNKLQLESISDKNLYNNKCIGKVYEQ